MWILFGSNFEQINCKIPLLRPWGKFELSWVSDDCSTLYCVILAKLELYFCRSLYWSSSGLVEVKRGILTRLGRQRLSKVVMMPCRTGAQRNQWIPACLPLSPPNTSPSPPTLQAYGGPDPIPRCLAVVHSDPSSYYFTVQFSCSVMSDSLWPNGLQHARPPCPSPTPRVYSSSCPLSWWCHPAISSSIVPFSSCLQSFPASGSFQKSQFFASGSQSIGVSASTSVLQMNIQDWSLGCTGWISLQYKGLSRVFSNTTVRKHQFFSAQLSL